MLRDLVPAPGFAVGEVFALAALPTGVGVEMPGGDGPSDALDQMGDLFKVVALISPGVPSMKSFANTTDGRVSAGIITPLRV